MSTITIAPPAAALSTVALTTAFPAVAVETCLLGHLIEAAKAECSIRGTTLPNVPAAIAKSDVHIDSLVMVTILCTVEAIVGFELPESIVRSGGYVSVESALTHVLSRIEQEWNKKKGVKS